MAVELRGLSGEVRAVDDSGDKRIAGYAAVFNTETRSAGRSRRVAASRKRLTHAPSITAWLHRLMSERYSITIRTRFWAGLRLAR